MPNQGPRNKSSIASMLSNLFSDDYLSQHLSHGCIYFYGQLIARPPPIKAFEGRLCMPDIYSNSALVCRSRITPPSPFKKGLGRVCLVLFSQLRSVQHCYARLSLRATRRRGKAESSFTPTPHVPGTALTPFAKAGCSTCEGDVQKNYSS